MICGWMLAITGAVMVVDALIRRRRTRAWREDEQ